MRPEFQTKLCTGRAAGLACDEFPFWVTNQAVNLSGLVADVQPVPGTESSPQGNDISGFYRKCDVDDGERFIVLPVKPWVAANGPSFGFTVNQGGASLCMTPEAPAAP
ncbi:NucA/NucB deoxyribonuclease domain-containing protein [Micromonospora sp. NPDC005161]